MLRILGLTLIALSGFAANSVLCRAALGSEQIDAATFSNVRLLTGALTLLGLVAVRSRGRTVAVGGAPSSKRWVSALLLFGYAVPFSFAYLELATGTGALILFGSVQVTMISAAWWTGERPRGMQMLGWGLAISGLIYLVLPGLKSPSWIGSAWMIVAGVSWGFYSLAGRGSVAPLRDTRDNFLLAALPALALNLVLLPQAQTSATGLLLAAISGSLTSACGYAIWYEALRGLTAIRAATVQLAVPPMAALAGVVALGETVTLRLVVATIWILGGIGLELLCRRKTT